MNKKIIITIFVIVIVLLAGVVLYLTENLKQQKAANQEMQELAELDKQEMENEYQRFADQYAEMKTSINKNNFHFNKLLCYSYSR